MGKDPAQPAPRQRRRGLRQWDLDTALNAAPDSAAADSSAIAELRALYIAAAQDAVNSTRAAADAAAAAAERAQQAAADARAALATAQAAATVPLPPKLEEFVGDVQQAADDQRSAAPRTMRAPHPMGDLAGVFRRLWVERQLPGWDQEGAAWSAAELEVAAWCASMLPGGRRRPAAYRQRLFDLVAATGWACEGGGTPAHTSLLWHLWMGWHTCAGIGQRRTYGGLILHPSGTTG